MGLLDGLYNFAQGASNSAAGTVSAPVDGISWLMRKAGLGGVIGDAPVGGSAWMAQHGLTAPATGVGGLLGEAAGNALPIVAAAKAPQIAGGLLRAVENAATPATMSKQAAMIDVNALRQLHPDVDFTLSQSGPNATLSKVVVPPDLRGQGVGSDFMGSLTRAADADGATLALSPSTDFGATSKARLMDFYRQFGFVPNKGRNMDFTLSESMYRAPRPTD